MKIVSVISLNKFPMWKQTFEQLLKLSKKVYVRFDAVNGDPAIVKQAMDMAGEKLGELVMVQGWQVPDWREDMMRMLDGSGADVVLCPDEDEMFGEGIEDELKAFWFSEKSGMMFEYKPLMAKDGRVINGGMPYPPSPHMKAFKWKQGLSYFPYHGDAKVAQYCSRDSWWMAKTKLEHCCCWTEKMEKAKHWRSNTPNFKGHKAVTILGFGPTHTQGLEGNGEIWSINNCYDIFGPEVLKYCTRIFEMHKFGVRDTREWNENAKYLGLKKMTDRNQMLNKDGQRHVLRLNELGKEGRRIIMQEKHPEIANSEAYPVENIARRTVDWFHGTPCYMAAMAIVEGFTRIDCIGIDQMDWEHSIQRECFAGWMMFALGRGIQLGGVQTWLRRFDAFGHKRYGYDYGPEWNEWCEKTLWQGFPVQLKFKSESRIVMGDMYKPGGK